MSSNLEGGTLIEFQGGRSPKEINPKFRIYKGSNMIPSKRSRRVDPLEVIKEADPLEVIIPFSSSFFTIRL